MADKNVNPLNIRIWGSDDDYVGVAPLGSTKNLTLTNLDDEAPDPFQEVGALSTEGPAYSPNDEVAKLKLYQGGRTGRTVITSSETTFKFQAYESTDLVKELYWDPKDVEVADGITKRKMGARSIVARSWLLGRFDGEAAEIDVIPHGEVIEREELGYSRENGTLYGFTVEIIGDWEQYDNYTGPAEP